MKSADFCPKLRRCLGHPNHRMRLAAAVNHLECAECEPAAVAELVSLLERVDARLTFWAAG